MQRLDPQIRRKKNLVIQISKNILQEEEGEIPEQEDLSIELEEEEKDLNLYVIFVEKHVMCLGNVSKERKEK